MIKLDSGRVWGVDHALIALETKRGQVLKWGTDIGLQVLPQASHMTELNTLTFHLRRLASSFGTVARLTELSIKPYSRG